MSLSTTLPGKPSNKCRWRMLDEDGEEVGQTEAFNKYVKRKKVVESYFDAASIIDTNNHMRQGGLALETAWQTQSWTNRVVATVLGIVETDAYLLYKKFHLGMTTCTSNAIVFNCKTLNWNFCRKYCALYLCCSQWFAWKCEE